MIHTKTNLFPILVLSAIFLLSGCEGDFSEGSNSSNHENNTSPHAAVKKTIDGTTIGCSTFDIDSNTKTKATIALGNTHKDVYLVISNTKNTFDRTSSAKRTDRTIAARNVQLVFRKKARPKALPISSIHQRIARFNHNLPFHSATTAESSQQSQVVAQKSIRKVSKSVGDTQTFYTEQEASSQNSTQATLRKIVAGISTQHGSKTLNVWVSDDSFDSGSGCPGKDYCVTQDMVDHLASTFLKTGLDNDIYDWVNNIYGEEWGEKAREKSNKLISDNDEITILLTDIPETGTIGYFYPKDNFTRQAASGSNEQIMFYIDAIMFANDQGGDSGWNLTDPMPQEVLTTLAHEFQHMIHFYQKIVLRENSAETEIWLNELLSETTEDLVATRLRGKGPRAVPYYDGSAGDAENAYGRYPLFNAYYARGMKSFNNFVDYSRVSSFGTYLVRQYGGAKLLHDIVHNPYLDERAILDAVHKTDQGYGKTFGDLLNEWGVAVLFSDVINPAGIPAYNTGDFRESSYRGISYEMGSINFFNYVIKNENGSIAQEGPEMYTSVPSLPPLSNLFYKVGTNLTGTIQLSVDLKAGTHATLVIKDSP